MDKSLEYETVGGRKVYGGGGIVPDVFVPMDTTVATKFFIACNRKATAMRFASFYFDHHKKELSAIDDYNKLVSYLHEASLESAFLAFAAGRDKLKPANAKEWAETRKYMLPQINALVGRYSKLGDDAFYHLYLGIDTTFEEALKPHSLF